MVVSPSFMENAQINMHFELVPKVGTRSRPSPPIWKMPKHKSLLLMPSLSILTLGGNG